MGEVQQLVRLLRKIRVNRKFIDRGVDRVDFRRFKLIKARGTRNNRRYEREEVYTAAIRVLEIEEDEFVRTGGKFKRRFTQMVAKQTGFRVPWLFNNFKSNSAGDDTVLLNIGKQIKRIHGEVAGVARGTALHKKRFLQDLVKWMRTGVRAVDFETNEKSNLEMARGAKGDCTELSRYAHAVLRLAGFKPKFIFIVNDSGNVYQGSATSGTIGKFHQCVAVEDPQWPGQLIFIDLYRGGIVSKPTGRWVEMPATAALSNYYSNLGVHLADLRDRFIKHIKKYRSEYESLNIGRGLLLLLNLTTEITASLSEHMYRTALQYNSSFPDTHYLLAHLMWDAAKDIPRAKRHNNIALRLMPTYSEARALRYLLNKSK